MRLTIKGGLQSRAANNRVNTVYKSYLQIHHELNSLDAIVRNIS